MANEMETSKPLNLFVKVFEAANIKKIVMALERVSFDKSEKDKTKKFYYVIDNDVKPLLELIPEEKKMKIKREIERIVDDMTAGLGESGFKKSFDMHVHNISELMVEGSARY